MKLILQTRRLFLREMIADDADKLALVLSDPENMRHYPEPLDRAGVLEWIERNRRRYSEHGCGLYSMLLRDTDELIGDCGLVWQDVDGSSELEVGYHVRRDLQGRGYAAEAAQACLQFGFAHWNPPRIIALILPENLQSCRVAEKLGMTDDRMTLWSGLPHTVYAVPRPISLSAAAQL